MCLLGYQSTILEIHSQSVICCQLHHSPIRGSTVTACPDKCFSYPNDKRRDGLPLNPDRSLKLCVSC